MNDLIIKKLTLADADQLQKISIQTFKEAFSSGNTEENMKEYIDEAFSISRLASELEDENSKFYFAILNLEKVGYIKINTGQAQTELKEDQALEIERIYVLKDFYGKNVAQALYAKAMQVAKDIKAKYVWLGVWEENQRAIHFYEKNGFVEFDRHIFKLGDDEQKDIMMKLTMQ